MSPSPAEARAESQGKSLESGVGSDYWGMLLTDFLPVSCSPFFLTPYKTSCPGLALLPVSCIHPHLSWMKMLYRLLRSSFRRHLLTWLSSQEGLACVSWHRISQHIYTHQCKKHCCHMNEMHGLCLCSFSGLDPQCYLCEADCTDKSDVNLTQAKSHRKASVEKMPL